MYTAGWNRGYGPTFAMEDLKQKLQTYSEQLSQVEALIASDPENEQFLKLRQDLVEVTKLTEDLLKYKHSQQFQQPGKEGGDGAVASAGSSLAVAQNADDVGGETMTMATRFEVGMRCEAQYQEKFYPAVVTGISGGSFTVVFIGFGNTEVLSADGLRPLLADGELVDSSSVTAGWDCMARYSGDGKWYEAVVEEVTDLGYRVNFVDYGNSEEVPLEYLRPREAAGRFDAANELTRASDGTYRIPDNLRVLPTDSEAERQRKRRRVKALKQQVREREQDEERDSKKNTWLAFQNRGAKRKVVGSMKSVRKESIFTSPDSVDGKVGVTGSGKGITEYGERKKFKFREPPDLR